MKIFLLAIFLSFFCIKVLARGYLPESVLEQVEKVSRNFTQILKDECDEKTCYSKGCNHLKHTTYLDQTGFLAPGIATIKPSEIKKNYVLSEAECSFAYESSLLESDLQQMKKRLATKLNQQDFTAIIRPMKLEAYDEKNKKNDQYLGTLPEQTYQQKILEDLRPHLFWMIGVILATVCLMILMLAFRLSARKEEVIYESDADEEAAQKNPLTASGSVKDQAVISDAPDAFLSLEQKIRSEPIIWSHITSNWLLDQEDKILIAARSYLSDDIKILPDDVTLMPQKVYFQRILKNTHQAESLMSKEDFIKSLDRIWKIYQELDESSLTMGQMCHLFSPNGLAHQLDSMPIYLAKVTVSFMDKDVLCDMLPFLNFSKKKLLLIELLKSDRASKEDLEESFVWLKSILKNEAMKLPSHQEKRDHEGVRLYVSTAASVFLEEMKKEDRQAILDEFKSHPLYDYWQGIFYPSMLNNLSDQILENMILEQKADAFCAWLRQLSDKRLAQKLLSLSPLTVRNLFDQKSFGEEVSAFELEMIEKSFASYLSKKAKKGEVDFLSIM